MLARPVGGVQSYLPFVLFTFILPHPGSPLSALPLGSGTPNRPWKMESDLSLPSPPPPGSSTWPLKKNLEESRVTSDPSIVLPSILMARGRVLCRELSSPWVWSLALSCVLLPVPCRACLPSQGTSDWSLALSLSSYSSGGEDGYVRIHYFDPQYFEFEFEA